MKAAPQPATDLVVASLRSSVVGVVHVAADAAGLRATAFADHRDALTMVGKLPGAPRAQPGDNKHIARFAAELARWDRGALARFTVPVALAGLPDFITAVLTALRGVARGDVVSYGRLAVIAGRPGAARAVGTAMRRNPLPLVIPCHRVIAGGGKIGGFSPSIDLKRDLLRHEGVEL